MYSLVCKKLLTVSVAPSRARVCGFLVLAPKDALFIRLFSSKKLASPKIKGDEKQSLAVSYLINSCGLSPEAAASVSKKLRLTSPEKSDLVLALLKNHGFSRAQISRIVCQMPCILKSKPVSTILPKLNFFCSIGVPAPVLARVVTSTPNILMYSLQNSIIPLYNILKSLLGTDEGIVRFIKDTGANHHFVHGVLKYTRSNIVMLRKYGVSESNVFYLVRQSPGALIRKTEFLTKLVDRVIELGLDTKNIVFANAMRVLIDSSNSKWEQKKGLYCRWGWSDSDFHRAFLSHPMCMSLSEKKIDSTMEFFVNEMGCSPSAIARYAIVMSYNLEKRIKPRCRVVQVLILHDLIKKSYSLSSFLLITDKLFLERYVSKYLEKVPLLEVYHGKLGLEDLGFSSCELSKVKVFL